MVVKAHGGTVAYSGHQIVESDPFNGGLIRRRRDV